MKNQPQTPESGWRERVLQEIPGSPPRTMEYLRRGELGFKKDRDERSEKENGFSGPGRRETYLG